MRAGWLAFVSTEITQLATVSYTMLTGLRVAVCLILLVFRPVRGAILFHQVEVVRHGTRTPWPVEGVATYVHGGLSVRHFLFRCTSSSNNGKGLSWSGKNGGSFHKTQVETANGIDLDFGTNPSAADAGIYVCQDAFTADRAELNITDMNPAANPVHPGTQLAVVGETVAIEFYASGLPHTQAGNYTWQHNGVKITHGTFEKDKRRLVIHNVQESHSGEYRFRVLLKFSFFLQLSALASTRLLVAARPQITHGLSSVTVATEWTTVTLTCNISSTFTPRVSWERVGGVIPPGNSVLLRNETMSQASLIIPAVRLSDEGVYYCNASFVSPTSSITLWATSQTQLRVTPTLRLVHNGTFIAHFLYKPEESTFTVECLGSGTLHWQGPSGTNISHLSSSSVYQSSDLIQSKQTLHFKSFSGVSSGMHTCRSSLGISESIMISNCNPVVYSTLTSVSVALNTQVILQVYTFGSDPVPSADHIHWYKDGVQIPTSQQYSLSSDRTSLKINVSDKDIAGVYECRVTTSQGQDSAFINVSFPGPGTVIVMPPTQTVKTGGNVIFECLVNGTLPYTLRWMFGSSPLLPADGITVQGNTLVINSATSANTGEYTCVVSDNINNNVTSTGVLQVIYPLTARVGLTLQTSQSSLSVVYEISQTPHTYSCFSDGIPLPYITWKFNGGPLPDGITQTPSSGLHVHLQWTRRLSIRDTGMYMCVAENKFNTSVAVLNITVTIRPRVTTIYPFPGTMLTVDSASPSLTFLSPTSATSSTLVCVSYGIPSPRMEWLTANGTKLTSSFDVVPPHGVASAVFTWRKNLSIDTVQCVAFSNAMMMNNQTEYTHGKFLDLQADRKIVKISITESFVQHNSEFLNPPILRRINFVVRLLNFTSCVHKIQDVFLLSDFQQQLKQVLLSIVLLRCEPCQNSVDSINIDTVNCSTLVPHAVVIKGHIEAQAEGLSVAVFRSLEEWVKTRPVVFINNSWTQLDINCGFLALENTSQECQPAAAADASFLDMYGILLVVSINAVLLLAVILFGVVLACCLHRKMKELKEVERKEELKVTECRPTQETKNKHFELPVYSYHRTLKETPC